MEVTLDLPVAQIRVIHNLQPLNVVDLFIDIARVCRKSSWQLRHPES